MPVPRRGLAAAAGLAVLLVACSAHGPVLREPGIVHVDGQAYRLVAVDAADPGLVRIAPGWIRHPRLGVLGIEREQGDTLLLRVALLDERANAAPDAAAPVEAAPLLQTLQAEGELVEQATALPRRGQWREHFDLAPDGAGTQRLLLTPARKSLALPQQWTRSQDGIWSRQRLDLPRLGFDYGGIARGDFDADGREDMALAMHLQRFLVLLGQADGGWRDASRGLPALAPAQGPVGSGTGLAVLPDPAGDRLLLLREPTPHSPEGAPAPLLAEYRWTGDGWQAEPIEPATSGSRLSLGLVPGCDPLLVMESAGANRLPLYRRTEAGWSWIESPLDADRFWYPAAIAVDNFDSQDCADIALARRERRGDAWTSRIDLLLSEGAAWRSIAIESGRSDRQVSALAAAPLPDGAIDLVAGDESGALDRYRIEEGDTVRWIAHLPAPAWRSACAVVDLRAFETAEGERRWLAAFAGEGSLYEPGRCASGGGLAEISWRPD